jgi:hypothetical protein
VTEESDPDHFWALRGGGGGMCTLSLSFSPIHVLASGKVECRDGHTDLGVDTRDERSDNSIGS